MRLGGPVFVESDDPEVIARAHRELGYRAASAPWGLKLEEKERIRAIADAYAKHDVLLAEVGVWNNLMDPDAEKRRAKIEAMKEGLALAEELGALCAINIAGSFSAVNWAGPHLRNLSHEAFELAVANAREIIDAVKPKRAKFAYEMMPFCLPHSADSYLRLIEAVERPEFAVHMDGVNLINGTDHYFSITAVIEESFEKLGPHIVSCHLKDILMDERALTVHLDEVLPGIGVFDIATYLKQIAALPHQPPVFLEHLETAEEYDRARAHVTEVARSIGVDFEQ